MDKHLKYKAGEFTDRYRCIICTKKITKRNKEQEVDRDNWTCCSKKCVDKSNQSSLVQELIDIGKPYEVFVVTTTFDTDAKNFMTGTEVESVYFLEDHAKREVKRLEKKYKKEKDECVNSYVEYMKVKLKF